jgi:site-specific recombinase XerD
VFGYDTRGERVRESLGTRDLTRAAERLAKKKAELEQRPAAARRTTAAAVDAFMERHANRAPETVRKYRRHVQEIADFLAGRGITRCDEFKLELFDGYVVANEAETWTWIKKLDLLKQFVRFCIRRQWCGEIDLDALKAPRLADANDVVPYTAEEVVRIVAACDRIGKTRYERLRARAMVLLMRHAGLRLSDVVTLSRAHLQGNLLKKRAVKNRKWIRVNLPPFVLEALDRLPRPKAATADCELYFASGTSSVRSLVKGAWRSLSAVFKLAAVPGAHPHRFRHTLATELLGNGGTIDQVAEILADSPSTIRRHYAKWSPERQARQDALLETLHGTNLAQAEGTSKPC